MPDYIVGLTSKKYKHIMHTEYVLYDCDYYPEQHKFCVYGGYTHLSEDGVVNKMKWKGIINCEVTEIDFIEKIY